MAGKKAHVVTGPLATPYREDGTRAYLYQGALLPDGLREGEVDRMVDLGLVEECDAPEPDEKPAAKKAASGKSGK